MRALTDHSPVINYGKSSAEAVEHAPRHHPSLTQQKKAGSSSDTDYGISGLGLGEVAAICVNS